MARDLQAWLREQCAEFVFRPEGVYVATGDHEWPLVARSAEELTQRLDDGGHLVSLPKESAALANVIEVALVDFLLDRLQQLDGADRPQAHRGRQAARPGSVDRGRLPGTFERDRKTVPDQQPR